MPKKPTIADDNRIALTINSNSIGGRILMRADPPRRGKRIHKVQGVRRLWIEERNGFDPVLHCWCGGTLELKYMVEGMAFEESMEQMTNRLSLFCDVHEGCEAREEGSNQAE